MRCYSWTIDWSVKIVFSLVWACIVCNTADAHKNSIQCYPKLQYSLILSIQAADKHHVQRMAVTYIVYI